MAVVSEITRAQAGGRPAATPIFNITKSVTKPQMDAIEYFKVRPIPFGCPVDRSRLSIIVNPVA